MKKLMGCVVSAAVFGLAATPAFAGWSNLKWGMTKSQVLVLYPQAVEGRSATTDDTLLTLHSFSYAGLQWRSVDMIIGTDQRLRQVNLNSREDKFPYIKNLLASQFGAPVNQSESEARFADPKRHNAIDVSYDPLFGLQVSYSRPSAAF